VRRERLDIRLTNLGLTESRAQAKVLIEQGLVTVDGEFADKPSRLVTAEMVLEVVRPPRYVSRGALKLEVAVREFGIDFTDCTVLDVGASTGGFTDYALQHGATHVVCVDVGRGQLHPRLVADPRVSNLEGLNARQLSADHLPRSEFDRILIDVSFISLSLILPPVWPRLRPGGWLIALIKPQFEAGRQQVGRGQGIIKDAELRREVADRIRQLARSELREAREIGWLECPVLGTDGSRESLLILRREPPEARDERGSRPGSDAPAR